MTAIRAEIEAERDARESWLPLVIVTISNLVCIFNVTSATTTVSAVVRELGTTVADVQLALVAYTVVIAAFVIDAGKVSAIAGVVPTQLAGLALYAIGMIVAGFAPSTTFLIVGQGIAGLGGALLVANGIAILGQAYVGRQLAFAVSVQAGMTGLGATLGLLVGGLLVSKIGWQAPFRFLSLVIVVTAVLTRRLHLPRPDRVPPRLDIVSIALVAIGVLLVIGGVNQIGSWGLLMATPAARFAFFGLSPVVLLLLAGIATLRLFVERQRALRLRKKDPLLAPEVVTSPIARTCIMSLLTVNLLLASIAFLLLLYSQAVLGHSAIASALALMPVSMTMLFGSLVPSLAQHRLSPRTFLGLATATAGGGTFLLAHAVGNGEPSLSFWIAEVLVGFGLGMALPLGEAVLLDALPSELASDVGSVRAIASFMGSAFGTAIAGAVLLSSLSATAASQIAAHPELSLPPRIELSPTTVSFVSNEKLRGLLSSERWDLDARQLEAAVEINVEARLVALRSSLAIVGLLMFASLLGVASLPTRIAARRELRA